MNFLVHSFCISVTVHLYNKTKVQKEHWLVKHSRKLILIRWISDLLHFFANQRLKIEIQRKAQIQPHLSILWGATLTTEYYVACTCTTARVWASGGLALGEVWRVCILQEKALESSYLFTMMLNYIRVQTKKPPPDSVSSRKLTLTHDPQLSQSADALVSQQSAPRGSAPTHCQTLAVFLWLDSREANNIWASQLLENVL